MHEGHWPWTIKAIRSCSCAVDCNHLEWRWENEKPRRTEWDVLPPRPARFSMFSTKHLLAKLRGGLPLTAPETFHANDPAALNFGHKIEMSAQLRGQQDICCRHRCPSVCLSSNDGFSLTQLYHLSCKLSGVSDSSLSQSTAIVLALQTNLSWNSVSYMKLSVLVSECSRVPARHREMGMALDHRAGQSGPLWP